MQKLQGKIVKTGSMTLGLFTMIKDLKTQQSEKRWRGF